MRNYYDEDGPGIIEQILAEKEAKKSRVEKLYEEIIRLNKEERKAIKIYLENLIKENHD